MLEVSKAKEKQLAGELHVLTNAPLEGKLMYSVVQN